MSQQQSQASFPRCLPPRVSLRWANPPLRRHPVRGARPLHRFPSPVRSSSSRWALACSRFADSPFAIDHSPPHRGPCPGFEQALLAGGGRIVVVPTARTQGAGFLSWAVKTRFIIPETFRGLRLDGTEHQRWVLAVPTEGAIGGPGFSVSLREGTPCCLTPFFSRDGFRSPNDDLPILGPPHKLRPAWTLATPSKNQSRSIQPDQPTDLPPGC